MLVTIGAKRVKRNSSTKYSKTFYLRAGFLFSIFAHRLRLARTTEVKQLQSDLKAISNDSARKM